MAEHTFVISCPELQFCEDVEAEDYNDAITAIGGSGYFGSAIEEGKLFSSIESARLFDNGLLVTHVLDTKTKETATYELRLRFTLAIAGEDPDYIKPIVY